MIIKKLRKNKKELKKNYFINMALKLIFMGTPEFAVPILESIYKSNHKILSVYTQSPKKKESRTKN